MEAATAFAHLAPFLREFIYRSGWDDLRPIQVAAIEAILMSDLDILITAGTASGKTEAAFLPILSAIHADAVGSVRALYVGPLKALINDQFQRLELVCQQGNIPVFRWHGDVPQSHKSALLAHPGGILQITPESLESLLINKPEKLRRLFARLQFVVIDEVHSFIESDRGVHLRSLLERISAYATTGRPRRVGLSATLGDHAQAQRWLNPHTPERVHVIDPPGITIATRLSHLHFEQSAGDVPPQLIDDLYPLTRNRKSLIFCNSRSTVEVVTAELNRLCHQDGLDERYRPHHGSISKELREDAEEQMRDVGGPASVVCTNTLELGIDIGQLDLVVQINSTHSVSSFVQRLGRSGRRPGAPRMMQLYTTELPPEPQAAFFERLPFGLLKAIAITNLFLEGWVEPAMERSKPFNVVYHQLLSRLTEKHGSAPRDLVGFFLRSGVFPGVSADNYATLLRHLAALGHIEQLPSGELILGLAGERIVRSREFYAVFQTPPEWNVLYNERTLGRISPSPELAPGECLLLVGRRWEVKDVLPNQQVVLVTPAKDARKSLFMGTDIPAMHPYIAQRVRALFIDDTTPSYLSQAGQTALQEARQLGQELRLHERVLFTTDTHWVILPWTGTRAAYTLRVALQHAGIKIEPSMFLFPWVLLIERKVDQDRLRMAVEQLTQTPPTVQELINSINPVLLRSHKYDEFLPETLLQAQAIEERLDWSTAQPILEQFQAELA